MTIAVPVHHMTEAELDGLHNRIVGVFAFAGMSSGPALDHATAAMMRVALEAIERHRAERESRRAKLQLVRY
jgi:hypothetical protein